MFGISFASPRGKRRGIIDIVDGKEGLEIGWGWLGRASVHGRTGDRGNRSGTAQLGGSENAVWMDWKLLE